MLLEYRGGNFEETCRNVMFLYGRHKLFSVHFQLHVTFSVSRNMSYFSYSENMIYTTVTNYFPSVYVNYASHFACHEICHIFRKKRRFKKTNKTKKIIFFFQSQTNKTQVSSKCVFYLNRMLPH